MCENIFIENIGNGLKPFFNKFKCCGVHSLHTCRIIKILIVQIKYFLSSRNCKLRTKPLIRYVNSKTIQFIENNSLHSTCTN